MQYLIGLKVNNMSFFVTCIRALVVYNIKYMDVYVKAQIWKNSYLIL